MIERTLRAHREIVIVLALFVALGFLFSVTTPLFEAPDEQWHFAFVQSVATGRGLPVQTPDHPTHLARQEGSQPPLYYLLAAAATFWIDTSDYPGIIWENPHYGYNVPGIVNDNKNLFIHTTLESFPYHGAVLAIHLARLLSVLMGALAVLFTYLLTLEIFADRKFLAASAAALLAFVPQFLFITSAVSNDSTIVAMSALSLWMTIRLFLVEPQLRDAIALGIATGLAALAKVSGLGLVLLVGLVLILVFFRHLSGNSGVGALAGCVTSASNKPPKGSTPEFKQLLVRLFIFGAAVFIVAGWWYLRNLILYGEPTGTTMMVRIFGARETPLTTMQLLTQLHEVWETFWVGFGWGNVRAQPVVYAVLEIVVGMSGIGLLLGFVRRRDQFHLTLVKALPFFVLALWIVVALVELVNWMLITQAPHGRLFFPALPALAPLAAFGLTQWVPKRVEPLVARGAALALFAFATCTPFAILEPAYAYPPFLSDAPKNSNPVEINYDNKMKLLGYDIAPNRVRPGEWATLTLYWQSLVAMDQDYSIGVHIVDAGGRVISARDSYPGHGLLPTRLWRAGQILRDSYWLPIAGDAPSPDIAWIQVSLYSRDDRRDLRAFDRSGGEIPTPIIGRLKISGQNPVVPRPQNAVRYSFGKSIELIGYDLYRAKVVDPANPGGGAQPSQDLDLSLYWKRVGPIDADYTVFVHIVDAVGEVIAQRDIQPAEGDDPTSLWDDGEIVPDHYSFPFPVSADHIEIGLYREQTGERLPVTDSNGNPLGDHVTLPVEVGR